MSICILNFLEVKQFTFFVGLFVYFPLTWSQVFIQLFFFWISKCLLLLFFYYCFLYFILFFSKKYHKTLLKFNISFSFYLLFSYHTFIVGHIFSFISLYSLPLHLYSPPFTYPVIHYMFSLFSLSLSSLSQIPPRTPELRREIRVHLPGSRADEGPQGTHAGVVPQQEKTRGGRRSSAVEIFSFRSRA